MLADGWIIAQSIATIFAAVVAAPAIIFAAYQVKVGAQAAQAASQQAAISARAASASALGVISAISRELQWKVLDDQALQPILSGAATPFTNEMKSQAVRAMLINVYALVYEFRQLEQIPETSWQAYKSDMTDFFTQPPNRARWELMKAVYSGRFQQFVEHEVLNRPF